MKVLYFAFANYRDRPLAELSREHEDVNRLLGPLAGRRLFHIVPDAFVSRDSMAGALRNYRDDLVLFHYGGHAGDDFLELGADTARARGIAALLGQCPNLRIVVLNGCATVGQVELLHRHGIAAVVATSSPVDDTKAAEFAAQLYASLARPDTLEQAFNAASAYLHTIDDRLEIDTSRGLALRGRPADEPVWTLSIAPGKEAVLQWRLFEPAPVSRGVDDVARQIRQAIAGGKIADAFNQLKKATDGEELNDEVTVLAVRWEGLARKTRLGLIRHDDAVIEQNQIVAGLLDVTRQLNSDGNPHG